MLYGYLIEVYMCLFFLDRILTFYFTSFEIIGVFFGITGVSFSSIIFLFVYYFYGEFIERGFGSNFFLFFFLIFFYFSFFIFSLE